MIKIFYFKYFAKIFKANPEMPHLVFLKIKYCSAWIRHKQKRGQMETIRPRIELFLNKNVLLLINDKLKTWSAICLVSHRDFTHPIIIPISSAVLSFNDVVQAPVFLRTLEASQVTTRRASCQLTFYPSK